MGSSTQNVPSGFFGGGSGGVFNAKDANPFCDMASQYIPQDLDEIFELVELMYLTMPPFKAVSERLVRYFLTDIVVSGASDDEREKYEDLFDKKLHMIQQLALLGDNYKVYGNAFASVYFPFDRWLSCPECGTQYHNKSLRYKFDSKTGDFVCTCPKCKHTGPFERDDRRNKTDLEKVKIIHWNPKNISIRVHPISGEIEYYYRLEQKFIDKVVEGDRFYLDTTPWALVRLCLKAGKGKASYFRFNPGAIFHLKSGSLAGLDIRGWGIPPLLTQFKLAYYIQTLRRYDEALAWDFIMPFRILSPANSGNGDGQDSLTLVNMQQFKSYIQDMVNKHRQDPTVISVAPFPIQYQMVGGEAKQLSPKDNEAQAMTELMNATGYPQDLYSGTLALQAAPVALRLMEKQENAMVDGFNSFLQDVADKVCHYFDWDPAEVELRSITLADDLERKGLQLQAAAGMDVSKQTAYQPFGIDYMEEQKRLLNEQLELQKLQNEAKQQTATQQQSEAMGEEGGEDGGAGGIGLPSTPTDIVIQADRIAQSMLQQPEFTRRSQLKQIQASSPALHAMVKQRLSEMRQEMSRQGRAQIEQQMMQGG